MVEPARIPRFHEGPFDDHHIERNPIKLWVWNDTIRCAIYPAGHCGGFNGYVQLPETSPDRLIAEVYNSFENQRHSEPDVRDRDIIPWNRQYHVGYDILQDIAVHGGLTYWDQDGWIGFDTGHAWDDWPDEELERFLNTPENQPSWRKLNYYWDLLGRDSWPSGRMGRQAGLERDSWDIDWTMGKLEREVEELAAQVYERLRGAGVLNGA